jgi:hypothetical protein
MKSLEALRRHGPQRARSLLIRLRVRRETLYAELVRAEAAGLVQINVIHERGRRWCEWEAT